VHLERSSLGALNGPCPDGATPPGQRFSGSCPAGWETVCGNQWFSYCIAPAPAPTPAPVITVSPQIQTQVSPQISPVFQQAFQPSGSPMTAGTTQTMPTSQSGTAPPPAGPDYGALMQSQQAMYEKLLTKVMQPVAQQPVAQQPAPYIPAPPPVTAPVPSQSAQALVSFPAPDLMQPPAGSEIIGAPTQISLQKQNFMPIILAVGVVGLFIAMNQKKGRKHAT